VRWRRALLGIAMAALVTTLTACDIPGLMSPTGGVYPGACKELGFAARRCAAIVARAEAEGHVVTQDVTSIEMLPPVREGGVSLGGKMIAQVRFHLAGAVDQTEDVWCPGVGSQDSLACAEDPLLGISVGVDHDVPCSGDVEPPNGCATLPPTARPAIVAAADIPIDHVGPYEVLAGDAGLPDGVLSQRSATLADPRPQAFWITGGIRLEVRSLVPGRPPVGSIYRDPYDGVEPVRVFVIFEVTETTPGGTLQVRDLIVE
jgi:hypothetical protein